MLGTLKRLNVRKVWNNEFQDFTPWLAREENISLLGKTLGMDIEVESTEVAVGPYSADMLARDTATGDYIIIENQLGKTDHDHLGKSITYASVLEAKTIIWIATQFTEEHCRAFEWLNDLTSEGVSFYAIQVELWQIDDSQPAVRFDVISKPTVITRQAALTKSSADLSETKKLQWEFWRAFSETLIKRKVVNTTQTPKPRSGFNVTLGKADVYLSLRVDTWENKIGIRVYIRHRLAEVALQHFVNDKEAIESIIGDELLWDPNPEHKDKTIALYRAADISNKTNWPEYLDWLAEKTKLFRKAFMSRVKTIPAS